MVNFLVILGPAAPTELEIFNNTASQFTVRWFDEDTSSVYPVTQYRVIYGNESVFVNRTNGSKQQVILKNLNSNTQYGIKVRSLTTNFILQSDDSQEVFGITRKYTMYTMTPSPVPVLEFQRCFHETDVLQYNDVVLSCVKWITHCR